MTVQDLINLLEQQNPEAQIVRIEIYRDEPYTIHGDEHDDLPWISIITR